MSKRELGSLAGDVNLDGPRAKRRKEVEGTQETTTATTSNVAPAETTENVEVEEKSGEHRDVVREQGLRIWQVVKDAVNKEGDICSPEFTRLPLKRQYPDYYHLIKQPICLDDIKRKLDSSSYASLEEVKQEFDLCFNNAKEYNVKESQIWQNAKLLQKQVLKEYVKITGKKNATSKSHGDVEDGDVKGSGDADGDDDDSKKKSNKPPNMTRLLKSRLQKLVDKSDDSGRVLSSEFMELPQRKEYPTYFKAIKRPLCIETIFRHLKRKEYMTSEDFANDVELVFSNAITFNQDHSQVWDDAHVLRDYFRQLMSDLPPPYSLSQYSKPAQNKIKLKVPATSASTPSASAQSQSHSNAPPHGGVVLKLPMGSMPEKIVTQTSESLPKTTHEPSSSLPSTQALSQPEPSGSAQTPTQPPATIPALSQDTVSRTAPPVVVPTTTLQSIAQPTPVSSVAVVTSPAPAGQFSPGAGSSGTPRPGISPKQLTQQLPSTSCSHYPSASYQAAPFPSAQTISTPTSYQVTGAPQLHSSQSLSGSPAPSLSTNHRPLKGVALITRPQGRPLVLDHRDGVKAWAMRFGPGEEAIAVVDIRFLGDDEEESSDEEGGDNTQEAEAEEPAEPEPTSATNKKKRPRGRPAKGNAKAKAAAPSKGKLARPQKAPKAPMPSKESIQVLLNGSVVSKKDSQLGEWEAELQIGSNVLEVGEKGGNIWKVYMERMVAC